MGTRLRGSHSLWGNFVIVALIMQENIGKNVENKKEMSKTVSFCSHVRHVRLDGKWDLNFLRFL